MSNQAVHTFESLKLPVGRIMAHQVIFPSKQGMVRLVLTDDDLERLHSCVRRLLQAREIARLPEDDRD